MAVKNHTEAFEDLADEDRRHRDRIRHQWQEAQDEKFLSGARNKKEKISLYHYLMKPVSVFSRKYQRSARCGPHTLDLGDRILMEGHGSDRPSAEQIYCAVRQAMKKGWREVSIYNHKGEFDPAVSESVNRLIHDMHVENRLHCCAPAPG